MKEGTRNVVIVGGVVGAVLAGQWIYDEYFSDEPRNNSLLSNAYGSVSNIIGPRLSYCRVPNVWTGFPIIGTNGQVTDAPNDRNNNMNGISQLAIEVFGDRNSANVVTAFASCECMDGDTLANNCGSCSLFNIHHSGCNNNVDVTIIGTSGPTRLLATAVGDDVVIAFVNGAVSRTQGFLRCLVHFKAYLERRCPDAIEYARQGNFEGFQIQIARVYNVRAYANSVQGNSVSNPVIRRRFDRLVRNGLLTA